MEPAEHQTRSARDGAMVRLRLPPVIDREAARLLAPELRAALETGGGIAVHADQVDRIGQVGLQLLLSAARSATAAGVSLAVHAPSPAFLAAVEITGLRPHLPFAPAA